MNSPYIDFADLNAVRSSLRPRPADISTTVESQPKESNDSPFIKALEAKLLLTMKSREGKVNLLNAYLTRLKGITSC